MPCPQNTQATSALRQMLCTTPVNRTYKNEMLGALMRQRATGGPPCMSVHPSTAQRSLRYGSTFTALHHHQASQPLRSDSINTTVQVRMTFTVR